MKCFVLIILFYSLLDKRSRDKRSPKKRYLIGISVICKAVALLLITSVVLVGIFSKALVAPCVLMEAYGENVTIKLPISQYFYSSVRLRWNESRGCIANVYHFTGLICSDQQLLSHRYSDKNLFRSPTRPIYMETGSTITANYTNTSLAGGKLTITLTSSYKDYFDFLHLSNERAKSTCDTSMNCYSSEKLPLTFSIKESGFHFLFLIDENGKILIPERHGIKYYFDIIYYNEVTVDYANNHSVHPADIPSSNTDRVKTADMFQFNKRNCNILRYFCEPTEMYYTLVIEDGIPRTDIIILIVIAFIVLVSPLLVIFAIFLKRCCKLI